MALCPIRIHFGSGGLAVVLSLVAQIHRLLHYIKVDITPEMPDVSVKRCRCGKAQPNFGVSGGKAVCCKQCKTPEMVDVKHKRCRCDKAEPYFGKVGGKAECCKQCKTPEMVDLKHKLCRCGKARPTFGQAAGKAVCCKQCKAPGMVPKNIRNRDAEWQRRVLGISGWM